MVKSNWERHSVYDGVTVLLIAALSSTLACRCHMHACMHACTQIADMVRMHRPW